MIQANLIRQSVLLVFVVLIVGTAAASTPTLVVDASNGDRNDRYRGEQLLVSKARVGGPADAAVREPAISQDNRTAIAIAYTSTATDIVRGPTGRMSNVYLVLRRRPFDKNAERAWKIGKTILVSRGSRAPNGDSWGPALNGDDNYGAKCIAFVSRASNLVRGDRNRKADVFVRSIRGGRLTKIATQGSATSVAVDGPCKRIAYSSSRGVFIHTRGGATERISSGKSNDVSLNSWAGSLSFERSGIVYFWRKTSGLKRIGKGTNPVLSGNGKSLLYERGGAVRRLSLVTKKTRRIGEGIDPAVTLAGAFIFWVSGELVEATGLHKPAASCEGGPREPQTSAHGNYVLYLCAPDDGSSEDRQLYLSYIGGKSHGKR